MSLKNDQGDGDEGKSFISGSIYSSLLTSKDRDFLLSQTGNQVKVPDLEGKVIGLYFAANWYPPCRNFTKVLISAYEQIKSSGSNFEVVFVSSDEDLEAFDNYRALMPWLAVPFSDLETKKALNKRFDVEGIPCLVILQPNHGEDGKTLHDGVELIYRYGVQVFPFTEDRLEELKKEEKEKHESQTLSNLLMNQDRDYLLSHSTSNHQVPIDSLIGKTVGLYFSAQWCVPGVKFTPKLISMYQKIKQMLIGKQHSDEDFEIVLVSSDRDQTEFDSHFHTMPWPALPFGDPIIKHLTRYFDVQGIPCLVIVGPDGKTITKNGRNLINLYQENAYPFTEAKLEELEKQMDEEAKSLPKSEYHQGHRHELNLVSEGNGGGPFICCDCDEQGSGWAYQCIECGYEVHPKCVRVVNYSSAVGS